MKITALLTCALLTAGTCAFAWVRVQDEPQFGPGPEHAILKMMAGSWTAEVQMEGSEPTRGTSESRLEMGGTWLLTDYKGEMMGMPFVGHSVQGYDATKKKYVDCWVDSWSKGFTLSEGTWDETKKTLTMVGKSPDPASGAMMEMYSTTSFTDADNMKFEMRMGSADAPVMMTILYKRKK